MTDDRALQLRLGLRKSFNRNNKQIHGQSSDTDPQIPGGKERASKLKRMR